MLGLALFLGKGKSSCLLLLEKQCFRGHFVTPMVRVPTVDRMDVEFWFFSSVNSAIFHELRF